MALLMSLFLSDGWVFFGGQKLVGEAKSLRLSIRD
jgi:hypothetical protein